jgi:transposase
MWKPEHRRAADRRGLRYPSDLTDSEWRWCRRSRQGPKTATAIAKSGTWTLEIVKRNELHRFVVLPKRWIVERTLAWISRNRRLGRDFERHGGPPLPSFVSP